MGTRRLTSMAHHRAQFSARGYQSRVPSVNSVYGGNDAPRAPYATEESVNDAPPHNDIPNNCPLYHITHYERPTNTPPPVAPNPILQNEEFHNSHQSQGVHVAHSSPTQHWMGHHDSHLCHSRNTASAGGLGPAMTHGEQEIKQLVEQSSSGRSNYAPSQDHPSGVNPHSSPIQSWHASYDSSLHQHRRKADEDASSVTTTGGQGPVSTSPCPNPQSREGGRSAGGVTGGQSHTGSSKHVPHVVPPAPWLSGFDSSLTSPRAHSEHRPAGAGYTSGVAELVHGCEH